MKDKMSGIIKSGCSVALAVFLLVTSLCTYWDHMSSFYYLTFLGNFLTGVFLLAAGILRIFNIKTPQFLILCFTVLMLLIFGVIVATQDFYIEDGYLFLHFINPLLVFLFYLLVGNQTTVKWYFVFTTLIMPFMYMIFAFIFGACTGDYIYYYLDYNEFGVGNTILFIFGILVGLISVSFGLYYLNRLIHKYILKNSILFCGVKKL